MPGPSPTGDHPAPGPAADYAAQLARLRSEVQALDARIAAEQQHATQPPQATPRSDDIPQLAKGGLVRATARRFATLHAKAPRIARGGVVPAPPADAVHPRPADVSITDEDGRAVVHWLYERGPVTVTPDLIEEWADTVNTLREQAAAVERLRALLREALDEADRLDAADSGRCGHHADQPNEVLARLHREAARA